MVAGGLRIPTKTLRLEREVDSVEWEATSTGKKLARSTLPHLGNPTVCEQCGFSYCL
jgi:hypothetical protein